MTHRLGRWVDLSREKMLFQDFKDVSNHLFNLQSFGNMNHFEMETGWVSIARETVGCCKKKNEFISWQFLWYISHSEEHRVCFLDLEKKNFLKSKGHGSRTPEDPVSGQGPGEAGQAEEAARTLGLGPEEGRQRRPQNRLLSLQGRKKYSIDLIFHVKLQHSSYQVLVFCNEGLSGNT